MCCAGPVCYVTIAQNYAPGIFALVLAWIMTRLSYFKSTPLGSVSEKKLVKEVVGCCPSLHDGEGETEGEKKKHDHSKHSHDHASAKSDLQATL